MILVAGSANIDFVTRVEHIPAPGETVLGQSYSVSGGGKGANQAVACGRSGGSVAFLGALGADGFAETLRASLRESGVQDHTLTLTLPTGAAFISVSEAGENAITVASGANAGLLPEHLGDLQGVTHLVMQLEIPLSSVVAYAQAAKAAGVQVVLNAAPARELPPELLDSVSLLVVNEGELASLVGPGEVRVQLRRAADLGPARVIVTLGGQGSLALDTLASAEHQYMQVPARRVKVLDTTGAGDTYVGALVTALSEGRSLPEAMHFAGVAAGLACTRAGAQPSMPTRAEIEEALP
ncbi:ribokinase (plasmid) [Deinococcus radiomollis]|uniref:ribokinase n=1 Tax=Deinococcus radiomollis TaxID=468916 RepID=UPI003892154E